MTNRVLRYSHSETGGLEVRRGQVVRLNSPRSHLIKIIRKNNISYFFIIGEKIYFLKRSGLYFFNGLGRKYPFMTLGFITQT